MRDSAVKIESVKVEVSGDIATDVGHASMIMKPAGAPATTVEVKFMAIWKKTRGQWRIYRAMLSPRAG
jgi:ketosteroid isomerase-like protein